MVIVVIIIIMSVGFPPSFLFHLFVGAYCGRRMGCLRGRRVREFACVCLFQGGGGERERCIHLSAEERWKARQVW